MQIRQCHNCILEQTGSLHLKCSFTYDFALHHSLKTWWALNNEKGTIKFDSISEDQLPSAVDSERESENENGIIATVLKGRAMYLMYPYRKVSTVYLSLVIRNPKVENSGLYTCNANTHIDKASTNSADVKIIRRSGILSHPESVSAVLGGTATLSCELLVDSRIANESEIYWTLNGLPTSTERMKYDKGSTNSYIVSYKIPSVSDNDVGSYECHAITSYDSVHSRSANLQLLRATNITRHPTDTKVALGDKAMFRLTLKLKCSKCCI